MRQLGRRPAGIGLIPGELSPGGIPVVTAESQGDALQPTRPAVELRSGNDGIQFAIAANVSHTGGNTVSWI